MKTVLRAVAFAALAMVSLRDRVHAAATDPLIARAHFVGSEQLFASPDARKLKEIWTLPGAVELRNSTVSRCATLLALYFGAGAAGDTNLIRPLFEDLLARESAVEFRSTPEFAIAVKLPDARVKVWDTHLRQLATSWKFAKPSAVNVDGFVGWEIRRSQAPQVLRFGKIGQWTVLAVGPDKLPLGTQLISGIRAQGAPHKPTGAWLSGDLNLARVKPWLSILGGFDNLPVAHFALSNRADFVRTLVTLDYARPHGWKAEPWRVPTNSIFDPLNSFLAARGIAPVLDAIPEVKQVGWSPTPNQISGWGLRNLPFQFYYATPTRDITNQLKRVAPNLKNVIQKTGPNLVGGLVQETNQWNILWTGLPLALPRFTTTRANPDFLVFEMFPLGATKTPAPAELFQQLSRNNLVLFDWEITQDRIPNWRQFYQLTEIATRRALTTTNTPGARWVLDVTPRLGECVTEITATSPTQMTLVRKSHLGLNSFELVTLSRWLDSVSFPSFGTFLPEVKPSRPRPASNQRPAK